MGVINEIMQTVEGQLKKYVHVFLRICQHAGWEINLRCNEF